MKSIKKGSVVEGTVINITEYGVFLKINNNYSGLVHISEISSNYVHNINDYVKLGDVLSARILDIDPLKKQLKLSFLNLDQQMKPLYRNEIIETEHGFKTLALKLPKWINEKIKEYSQKDDI